MHIRVFVKLLQLCMLVCETAVAVIPLLVRRANARLVQVPL